MSSNGCNRTRISRCFEIYPETIIKKEGSGVSRRGFSLPFLILSSRVNERKGIQQGDDDGGIRVYAWIRNIAWHVTVSFLAHVQSFSPRVSDRSERLSLARSGSILFSNEHESISELEEQFPRMDIPDLDHVRDPLPNMHRDMDNLLPRIVVHNMRLQVTEHRLAFERKEEGKMVSKLVRWTLCSVIHWNMWQRISFCLSVVKRIADVRVPSGRLQEEFLNPVILLCYFRIDNVVVLSQRLFDWFERIRIIKPMFCTQTLCSEYFTTIPLKCYIVYGI